MSALTFPDFQGKAACHGVLDVDFYAPSPPSGEETREQAKAKTVCRSCGVNTMCLKWALDNDESGIWGGLTEEERRHITGRKPARAGTGRPQESITHGREAGAKAHRRRGEEPCGECLTAERTARRTRQAS